MNRVTFLPATGQLAGGNAGVRPDVPAARAATAASLSLRCATVILAVMAAAFSGRAYAAGGQQLSGHVPPVIQRLHLQPIGDVPATNRLRLALGLRLPNTNDLNVFLQQLNDPTSTNYHKYLTPEQFTRRFGPSQRDYQSLIDFARANGFDVVRQHSNNLLLDVEAPVANIETAFQVRLRLYQHPKENRTFFSPDVEPTAPPGLPLLDISGLNNYAKPHAKLVSKPVARLTQDGAHLGSGPSGLYFGYDFRAAYAPGVTLTGAGQSLALVEFDGYSASDIAEYDALAGLPSVPLQNVLLDGFGGAPTGTGGEVEVSLDIEMANAMAPGLARIISYEGNPNNFFPNDVLVAIADDNAAKEISCSWGWSGGPSATTDQIMQQMIAQGQSFFDASGDVDAFPTGNGTGSVDDPNSDNAPSDDPYMTQVGATELSTTGPLGSYISESVWQEGGGVGSSGGISSYYAIPTWQQPVSMATNGGSTAFRNLPDVAMVGQNIFVIADSGGELGVGGTSCAAPLWAAFIALANEKAALTASPSVGFLNPTIYPIALGPLYSSTLHDITNGNNTNDLSPTNFYAEPGFDLCTGFGSPTGQPLIDALVPATLELPILQISSNSISGGNGDGMIDPNDCVNLSVELANAGAVGATAITATLSSLTPNIFVGQPVASYPNILAGASATNSTYFTVSAQPDFVCGTPVTFQLVVKSAQITETNFIQLPTGSIGPPVRFDNNASTPIPVSVANGTASFITVSGINAVGKVTVSLYMTAPYDEYIYYYLVGPDGTDSLLAENDGGIGANFGAACAPDSSRTTFDDDAPQSINAGFAPFAGSYAPVTPLSVFNLKTGTNVNGVWQLYAYNELTGYTANLNCWSLFISPEQCATGIGTCPGSDLAVTMSDNPVSITQDNTVTFTIYAVNNGPSDASNVVVQLSLPPELQYLSSTLTQGKATQNGTGVTYSLGSLDVTSNATIEVEVVGPAPGFFTSTATIGSPTLDPNPNNNTASSSVLVVKPAADLAVAMSAFPASVPLDGQVTFTMWVTNKGPNTAQGVTLTNLIPANVNVVSASTSVGTISGSGTLASIGTLNKGAGAVVTLVFSPTALGSLTLSSVVGLSTNEFDPVPNNNKASANVTVAPAADLGLSLAVVPSPTIAGANFTNVITVTNAGPNQATTVTMNETLSSGVAFISASQGTASQSGGVVTWNIGNMAAGSSQTLTNVLLAPALLQGVLSNVLVTSATVSGQPTDPNPANNTVVVSTINLPPTVIVVPGSITLAAPAVSVNPGETVVVQLGLKNIGNIPTTNLVATLQTNAGVTPSTLPQFGPQTYGALSPGGGTGVGQFSFTANSTNGGTIVAVLQLQDGANNLGTANFTFVMPNVTTFWNTNLISIPATNYLLAPYDAAGPAGPCPSTIYVSGVTSYVANITVTLSNLYHTYPSDIELLLVGPGGQNSILLSDAALHTTMTTPVTITFDQTAPTAVLANASLASGSFQPGLFNSPNLASITGVSPRPPAGPYTANLSIFTGLPPNGWWQLYAYDSKQGDFGAISNGWSLSVATLVPVNPVTHVGLGVASSPAQVLVGSNVTFTIGVTNFGTNATTVYLTNQLSPGLSFVSSAPVSPGNQSGQFQYYNLGVLPPQSNLTLTITASANAAGAQSDSVSVGSSVNDPNSENHQAAAAVTAAVPVANLSAGISAVSGGSAVVPGSKVIIGTNVVYTLFVTNNGPEVALNVVGQLLQSTVNNSAGVFTNAFGNIPSGSWAAALFTNAPSVAGFLTNQWSLATASSQANPASASAILPAITVAAPEPVIVAGGVRLLSESFSPPNGAIDSNETVTVAFTLSNVGLVSTTNLTATLLATNGVFPVNTNRIYGVLAPGNSTAQSFQFRGSGLPGATIAAVLVLSDNSYALGSVSYTFVIPSTTSFTNTAAITIPQFGAATPYPSGITVSGFSGIVSKATATIRGLTHPFPRDVDILLTSPSGLQTLLMGHVGGAYSVSNLVIDFDQNATQPLSAGLLSSGTNLPTQGGAPVLFPGFTGPAPANTNLNVFYGANPNGVWSLYAYSDTPGNGGVIANGWSLSLSVINPVNPAGTLAVGMNHAPDPVLANNLLTFTVGVTNLSSAPAAGVVLSDTLPPNTALVSAASTQGTVNTNLSGLVTFNVGTLAGVDSAATATLQVEPLLAGVIINSATASSPAGVSSPQNTASNSVTVNSLSSFSLAATTSAGSVVLTLATLPGQTGQNYIIQVSTNLENWTGIATNTAVGAGQFSITNNLTNGPAQFYRALHLPQ